MSNGNGAAYWSANLRLMAILLVIWFIVSFGFGILFRSALDSMASVGGAGLGFWFAQQGSIYCFLILIIVYAWRMGQLDRQFGVEED